MCTLEGYVVYYAEKEVGIEPHFCREYGDCGGGQTFHDAIMEVAKYYEKYVAELYKAKNYTQYCKVRK